jgi:hypothetical protein
VRAGATVGVRVVLTNATGDLLPIDVHSGCALFEIGAYDGAGARRDYVVHDCGFGRGCGGPTLRLWLEPGGTVTKRLSFTARVTQVSGASGCRDADGGRLPPGRYSLRASGRLAEGLAGAVSLDAPVASAPIQIIP